MIFEDRVRVGFMAVFVVFVVLIVIAIMCLSLWLLPAFALRIVVDSIAAGLLSIGGIVVMNRKFVAYADVSEQQLVFRCHFSRTIHKDVWKNIHFFKIGSCGVKFKIASSGWCEFGTTFPQREEILDQIVRQGTEIKPPWPFFRIW
jgi:hypothetical protein